MIRSFFTIFFLFVLICFSGAQNALPQPAGKAPKAEKSGTPGTPGAGEAGSEKPEIDGAGDYPIGQGSHLFFWLKGEVVDFTPPSDAGTRWVLLGGQAKEDPEAKDKKKKKNDKKKEPPEAAKKDTSQGTSPAPAKEPKKEAPVWVFWGIREDARGRSLWTCEAKMEDKPVCRFTQWPLENETLLQGRLSSSGDLLFLLAHTVTLTQRVILVHQGQVIRSWAFDPEVRIRDLGLSNEGRIALCGEEGHPSRPFLWTAEVQERGNQAVVPAGWRGTLTSLLWVSGEPGSPEVLQAAGRGVPDNETDPDGQSIQTFFYTAGQWQMRTFAGVGFFPAAVYLAEDKDGSPQTVYWGLRADRPDGAKKFWFQAGEEPLEVSFPEGDSTLGCWAFHQPRWALAFRDNPSGKYKLCIDSPDLADAEGLPDQARLRVLILGEKK